MSVSLILTWVLAAFVQTTPGPARASIDLHDNTQPAGALTGGVLTVRLVAGTGSVGVRDPNSATLVERGWCVRAFANS